MALARVPLPRLLPRLGYTVALVVLALAGTEQLRRATGLPSFLLFLPVVVFTAARWGAVTGLAATALSAAGMAMLLEPRWSVFIADPRERVLVATFVVVSAAALWVASLDYRLRQAMGRSEAEFRAFFELAAVGSAKVEPRSGRILQANEQMCAMTGYTLDVLLRKTIAEITHPDDRERDRTILAQILSGQRTHWSTEKRYVRSDGTIVWVLVNGTIIRYEDGRPDHFIAHAVDISSRRRAEEDARDANRLKDEFLATLSHELRTPLNVVAGWIHLLSRDIDAHPPQVRRVLPVISRNVDSLRRLTDDLLGMSDALTGRVVLARKRLDLSEMLTELVHGVSVAGQTKGISMTTNLEGGVVVDGDETRLRQVFWNLISNALKFTPEGGSIHVAAGTNGKLVRVRVSDTGIGITPSFLPHVFDKFRQEDGTHTRERPGLGLGLAVARQFVELHGGTITAESAGRGTGSTFTVTLPARNDSLAVQLDAAAGATSERGEQRRTS